MSVRRPVLSMLAVGAGLLAAPTVAPGQGPRPSPTEAAVQADQQRTIIAPTAGGHADPDTDRVPDLDSDSASGGAPSAHSVNGGPAAR